MSLSKSAVQNQQNISETNEVREHKGYSFYGKLLFLYFLNLIDWLCTEALIASGKFYEANPIMRPVLGNFWMTILIKGVMPLALIGVCALIYKLADYEEGFMVNLLLYVGITVYAFINLWHILNFVLLFSTF